MVVSFCKNNKIINRVLATSLYSYGTVFLFWEVISWQSTSVMLTVTIISFWLFSTELCVSLAADCCLSSALCLSTCWFLGQASKPRYHPAAGWGCLARHIRPPWPSGCAGERPPRWASPSSQPRCSGPTWRGRHRRSWSPTSTWRRQHGGQSCHVLHLFIPSLVMSNCLFSNNLRRGRWLTMRGWLPPWWRALGRFCGGDPISRWTWRSRWRRPTGSGSL